ncbi:family 43 glycosylhydrolase [Chitinophaga horti]|uniref:Family 43 glycosylhydrolase n=1 Tax=Chitinophaga horti TaxID=2920382 RepID=A0ABY6J0J4_9BACT|nr:family 43 glycosylhydrolase [Chitinophaga horti]UYQ93188.1 family 43 glycosylhydrolase [Chitinophaga horti]
MANPIVRHVYTADPTALVHEGRVYLFTGHDEPPPGVDDYVMHDWQCFSSGDMLQWQDHGSPLSAADFKWASGDAYASKVICYHDKFYWFVAVTNSADSKSAVGVAVADVPYGPYQDALGRPLITHDMLPANDNPKANLDPTVLLHDDRLYICWGHQTCYSSRLNEAVTGLDASIQTIALPQFSEGAHLHERDGWFYLSYGYGMPEQVAYAMSRDIAGPWNFTGILNDVPENCETNRPCVLHFAGKDYFFYHNGALPGGGSHRRSVCVNELFYEEDGTMRKVIMK